MAQVHHRLAIDHGQDQSPGLINTTRLLLVELLRWQVQPNLQDEVRTRRIRDARYTLNKMVGRSLMMKSMLARILESLYQDARECVGQDASASIRQFPEHCPYTLRDILSPFFFPSYPSVR